MSATIKNTDADKLRLSIIDIAGATADTCAKLETLLSAAGRYITTDPDGRAHAQRLLEIALYLVQTLDNDVDCMSEEQGIQVGSEDRR